MRISIPTLPSPSSSNPAFLNPLASITLPLAIAKTSEFLSKGKGKTLVITGAGVSVDSGIRAYRGDEGHCECHTGGELGSSADLQVLDTTNPNYR